MGQLDLTTRPAPTTARSIWRERNSFSAPSHCEAVDGQAVLRCTARVRQPPVRGVSPRAARAARRLTVLASIMLALEGCSGSFAENAAPDTSAMPVRTSGPLADGFEIEPGSALIGAVFPTPYPYDGEGQQAVLRVDRSARSVVDGYVQQAQELGYLFDSAMQVEKQWCADLEGTAFTDDDPTQPFSVICDADGSHPDGSYFVLDGRVDADGQGFVHMTVSRDSDSPPPFDLVPEGPVAPVSDAELASDLASTTDDPPIRLVEGTALAFGPIGPCQGCGTYLALLRVTGDLTEVMRGFDRQFSQAGFAGPEGLIRIGGDLVIGTGQAGGGYLSAVGVEGEPSYILIQRVYD